MVKYQAPSTAYACQVNRAGRESECSSRYRLDDITAARIVSGARTVHLQGCHDQSQLKTYSSFRRRSDARYVSGLSRDVACQAFLTSLIGEDTCRYPLVLVNMKPSLSRRVCSKSPVSCRAHRAVSVTSAPSHIPYRTSEIHRLTTSSHMYMKAFARGLE